MSHYYRRRRFGLKAGWNLGLALNPKRLDFGWLRASSAAGGIKRPAGRGETDEPQTNDTPPPHPLQGGVVMSTDCRLRDDEFGHLVGAGKGSPPSRRPKLNSALKRCVITSPVSEGLSKSGSIWLRREEIQ